MAKKATKAEPTTTEPQAAQAAPQAENIANGATSARIERARQRRQELRELSNSLKTIAKITGADEAVNKLLIEYYKTHNNATELNTYEQWRNKGFQVKKGSQSFMVWGKPLKEQNKEQGEETDPTDEMADFFPVCHLFDISQVAPIQTKSN